ncbi:Glutamate synthase large subunit-like protein [Nymphon striatum]|nr:Glutamate synthase large subunit-like protein [Nymphon striatum]
MKDIKDDGVPRTVPVQSATFSNTVNAEIRRAAATGIYDIRGGGAKRKVPHFDDLLFLGASISRYPLEGYREKCETKVTLGTRFAKNPIELDIPVTIAGMSFGALSGPAKEALGRGATMAGTSTTTGDGGMTEGRARTFQQADAIEIVVGQGAKPGGGGMLLGQKISDRVAMMRNLPKASISVRPAVTLTGPDRTIWKSKFWNCVKSPVGKNRSTSKSAAPAPILIPLWPSKQAQTWLFWTVCKVAQPPRRTCSSNMSANPFWLVSERRFARFKTLECTARFNWLCLAAFAMAQMLPNAWRLALMPWLSAPAALIALGDNDPKWESEYNKLGTTAGAYDDWHEGQDPAGITTQDPDLMARFDPIEGGRRLNNYLKVMTLEAQTIARACGKNHLHNLEPEDLCALTMEAAAMAKIPLAGTDWYPGKSGSSY